MNIGKERAVTIRELAPDETDEIARVARRMRSTLVEVLGDPMYSDEWLKARVRFHLEPDRSVFLACDARGRSVGHTIVRVEAGYGLFSTTYVEPTHRRLGVARELLARGEAWMRERELPEAVTFTAAHNDKLIALFRGRGYALEPAPDRMVRLFRPLDRSGGRVFPERNPPR